MKIFSAGCEWIVKIFHRGEDSIEDGPHTPLPSESVGPKPTEVGSASIANEATSSGNMGARPADSSNCPGDDDRSTTGDDMSASATNLPTDSTTSSPPPSQASGDATTGAPHSEHDSSPAGCAATNPAYPSPTMGAPPAAFSDSPSDGGTIPPKSADVTESFSPPHYQDTLWGNIFVQEGKVGCESYHFQSSGGDGEVGAYISYEHPDYSTVTLDDGSLIPSQVPFQNITWDANERTFCGTIEWYDICGTTRENDKVWRCEMKFDSGFSRILSGKKMGTKTITYGVDVFYVNAAVDRANSTPAQALMDAAMAALSTAQENTMEFLSHLLGFFDHRQRIDAVYSDIADAKTATKLESLSLSTAPFALEGENEFNPDARQQRIGGGAVQTMDELYEAAEIIKPEYEQYLHDLASKVKGITANPAPKLKERERATEKARDSYEIYQPGPSCSWLFDIVRGQAICENVDAVLAVAEAVEADSRVEGSMVKCLMKFKNRFSTPTPAGFRDVMLIIRLEVTDPKTGHRVLHNCELQVHLEPVLKFSKENKSHRHYEYFRTYFVGASETVAARMKDLKAVVGNTANHLISSHSNKTTEELENDQEVGRDFLERVLRDVMNSGDTERLDALFRLLYKYFNEYDLAMCVLQQKAEVEKARYGPIHKDVAWTCNHMGNVLKNQGKYDEAMAMLQNSLDIRLQVLPPDHTDIAASYNNMGLVLDNLGKYDDALAKYEQCLKIQLEALGPKHEKVATTYNNMAIVLRQQGKYKEAMEKYEESLKIKLEALGPKHEDVAISYNNMGLVLQQQGKYEEAMKNYEESLKIDLKALGSEHTLVAKSYNNMAIVLEQQGKYKEAMEKYEKTLEIDLKALGRDHTSVGDTRYNMANVLNKQGDLSAAAEHLRECVRIRTNAYGEEHEKVVNAMKQLAYVCLCTGEYGEAMEMYQKYLDIEIKTLGRDHTDVGDTRYGMALSLEKQGDVAAAAEHLRECVRIYTNAYGENNQEVVDAMKFLADVCKDMGEYGEAIELRQKRLNTKIKAFGRDDTSVGDTRYDMALLLEKHGDLVATAEHLRECVRIYTNAYGEDHEEVVDAKGFLARVEGRLQNG